MSERLDPTQFSCWSLRNIKPLAEKLGYIPDNNFEEALSVFILEIVFNTKTTNMLGSVAVGFFRAWQPPLIKTPKEELVLLPTQLKT